MISSEGLVLCRGAPIWGKQAWPPRLHGGLSLPGKESEPAVFARGVSNNSGLNSQAELRVCFYAKFFAEKVCDAFEEIRIQNMPVTVSVLGRTDLDSYPGHIARRNTVPGVKRRTQCGRRLLTR